VRKVFTGILIGLILLIALLPWQIKGGNMESLVPNDLRQAPFSYEATVTAARASTIEAIRSATSIIQVIPVGTVSIPNVEAQPASTSIVRIVTLTNEATLPLASTPTVSPTQPVDGAPPTPIGLVDTEDLITDEQLTEQLKMEPEGSQLKDLNVSLTETGFQVEGALSTFPVGGEKVTVRGEFLIKNYSLVVNVSSITLNGTDVTLSYHEEVESRMDTSLYRLLPERYVQTFMLADGQFLVFSKVRK
jgi:hypothetical protein